MRVKERREEEKQAMMLLLGTLTWWGDTQPSILRWSYVGEALRRWVSSWRKVSRFGETGVVSVKQTTVTCSDVLLCLGVSCPPTLPFWVHPWARWKETEVNGWAILEKIESLLLWWCRNWGTVANKTQLKWKENSNNSHSGFGLDVVLQAQFLCALFIHILHRHFCQLSV